MTEVDVPDIPGAVAVASWFGAWPSFHDAEVVFLRLNRSGQSQLSVHAWNMTDRTYEENGQQHFVLERHAVVTFTFEGISGLQLLGFNSQNVLAGLDVGREGADFVLHLHPCYGVSGRIVAARMVVSLTPGKPTEN